MAGSGTLSLLSILLLDVGLFSASETKASAVNFLDFFFALELLDHAGEETPAFVFQFHTVRDFADAGGLRESGEMSEHLFSGDGRYSRSVRFAIGTAFLGHVALTQVNKLEETG